MCARHKTTAAFIFLIVSACCFSSLGSGIVRLRFEYPFYSQFSIQELFGGASLKGGFGVGAVAGNNHFGFGLGFSPAWGAIQGLRGEAYTADTEAVTIIRDCHFNYNFNSIELLFVAELFGQKEQSCTGTFGTGVCFGRMKQDMHFVLFQNSLAAGRGDKTVNSGSTSGFPLVFGIGYAYRHFEIFTNARFCFLQFTFAPYDYAVAMDNGGSFAAQAPDTKEVVKTAEVTIGFSLLFGTVKKKKPEDKEIKE